VEGVPGILAWFLSLLGWGVVVKEGVLQRGGCWRFLLLPPLDAAGGGGALRAPLPMPLPPLQRPLNFFFTGLVGIQQGGEGMRVMGFNRLGSAPH